MPDVGRTGAEASPLVEVEAVVLVVEVVDEAVLLVELDVEDVFVVVIGEVVLVDDTTVDVAAPLCVPGKMLETNSEPRGKTLPARTHSQHLHMTSQGYSILLQIQKNSPAGPQNMQLYQYKTPHLDSIPRGPSPYPRSSHMSRLSGNNYLGTQYPNSSTCPSDRHSPSSPTSL